MKNIFKNSFLILGATAIMSAAAITEPSVQHMIDNAYHQQTDTTIFKDVEVYRFNEIKSEIEKHLTEEDNIWFDLGNLKYFLNNVNQDEYKNALKDKSFYQNELVNLMSYLEEVKLINKEMLELELANVVSDSQPYLEFDKSKQYYVESSENNNTHDSHQLLAEQTEVSSEELVVPIKNIAELRDEQRGRELSLKLAEVEPIDFDLESIKPNEEESPNDKIVLFKDADNKESSLQNVKDLRVKHLKTSENVKQDSMKM